MASNPAPTHHLQQRHIPYPPAWTHPDCPCLSAHPLPRRLLVAPPCLEHRRTILNSVPPVTRTVSGTCPFIGICKP